MIAARNLFFGALSLTALTAHGITSANPAQIDLPAGFMPDPRTEQVIAGGQDAASVLDSSCVGHITLDQPSAIISYGALAESSQLGIFTAAPMDTTLVVQAPDGRVYCNDDSDYLGSGAAGLAISPAVDGSYKVWVGTHHAGNATDANETSARATLAITEYGAPMWLTLNLEAGYDSLLMDMVNNDIEFGDDSGEWANDGECDDPRFIGPGMTMMPPFDHERRDASDCRVLFGLGEIRLGHATGN